MSEKGIREEARRSERAERIREMKRKKLRQEQIRRNLRIFGIPAACALVVIVAVCVGMSRAAETRDTQTQTQSNPVTDAQTAAPASSAAEARETQAEGETASQAAAEETERIRIQAKAASVVKAVTQTAAAVQITAQTEQLETAEAASQGAIDETNAADSGSGPNASAEGVWTPVQTQNTASLGGATAEGETMESTHAILIDAQTGEIIAQKEAQSRITPASMTKVLTILVAAEHVTDIEDTFTMPIEITDYCYRNDCSNAGFEVGEVLKIKDLFYGTILPSGAEAALGLAYYVAGSQEAFAELMNEKLEQLGIADTAHFTNCMGIYEEEHYCTTEDVAVIMKAAMDNPFCREVLSAHTYTTSVTQQHPEGMVLSNWFLRRIEDKDCGGTVVGAKTGYVEQSGSCAVSYGENTQGETYICVTADAHSSWRCIYDHVAIYHQYLQ